MSIDSEDYEIPSTPVLQERTAVLTPGEMTGWVMTTHPGMVKCERPVPNGAGFRIRQHRQSLGVGGG